MQDHDTKCGNMQTGTLIHMLSNLMKRNDSSAGISGAGELTVTQKHVLKFILLASLHRDVYQKDVEEEFQIRKSTVTGILKLMEKNGFIRRESAQQDARLKKLVPTEKAEALRPSILEHIRRTETHLTEGIPPEELKICRKVMCRMLYNLAEKNRENEEVDQKDE
ncbi:MAG TPA: MarR family winged helix-turn-helix transcriptional regulator [Candidatus Blautia intestinipullorum]|nr:MarR family winged helix-turn-helix transcriptional regulator [Candidatus Blautia intestinipullorum]